MKIPLERTISLIHNVRFGGLPTHYPSIAAWEAATSLPAAAGAAWKNYSKKDDGSRPLGIYLNVPFCRAKCGFCFLDVIPAGPRAERDKETFLSAVEAEMRLVSGLLPGRAVSSVYIGGGTPNVLSAAQLGRLLAALRGFFRIPPGTQVSLEANPDLFDREKLAALAEGGVNMLLLGIQSFSPGVNAVNGRVQDVSRIKKVFALIRAAGIKTVNADLLCGLKGQTKKSFLSDAAKLAALGPSQIHLNRIKPLAGNLAPGLKAELIRWQEEGLRLLERRGYKVLDEESASRGGARNVQGDYRFHQEGSLIGLGPGALSHVRGALRWQNLALAEAYSAAALSGRLPVLRGIKINDEDELRHYLLNEFMHGEKIAAVRVGALFGSRGRALFRRLADRLVKTGALRLSGGSYCSPLENDDWLNLTAGLYAERHLKTIAAKYHL